MAGLERKLQAWFQSERQAADDLRKAFSEAEARNSELGAKLKNVTRKVDQLQELVQRLEERLSNSESEIQVLRQQALTPENRNLLNGETKTTPDMILAVREPESEEKPHKNLNKKQQGRQDLLLKCFSQNLGFVEGKPVAACVIYKCLFHWKSFDVGRTTDLIIQIIAWAIEVPNNKEVLAYWLSNSATLLLLLQHTLKETGAASLTPKVQRTTSTPQFRRMSQGLSVSPSKCWNKQGLAKLDELRQVEEKYPAQLFKHNLTELLKKIYEMIRDNLKKEIYPYLGLCIKASQKEENDFPQQTLMVHWQSIVKSLNTYLNLMKANNVPALLVEKVLTQGFHFINVQLFNSILLRRECCSLRNGEYVEAGLAELKQWCVEATDEHAGAAWDELRHIRQAIGFLVIKGKPKITLDEVTREICPVLSIQQLYRISTMYWDNKYGTHSVSSEFIANMRVMMEKDLVDAVTSSFLLDDDSSIPFAVEDISKSMQQVDVNDIEFLQLLSENPHIFGFLGHLHQWIGERDP